MANPFDRLYDPSQCSYLSWILGDGKQDRISRSADGFVQYRLKAKDRVSSTSSIFTLEPATASILQANTPNVQGGIKSFQIKQPQLQIARNYTLLPTVGEVDNGELKFLIRKERNGEVSGYLHRLPVNSEIEVRGPVVDFALPPNVRSVVFLAGGTGIVPAMQIAETVAGQAHVQILWANRRREDCMGGVSDTQKPRGWTESLRGWFMSGEKTQLDIVHHSSASEKSQIVLHLQRLKHASLRNGTPQGGLLQTDYFVDEENSFISSTHLQQILQHDGVHAPERFTDRNLLLVSGPDGFVEHWAGARQWVNGREAQGPLGGVLSTLNTTGWDVVKL